MSEADVLIPIKTLVVREENTMVARVGLHEMRQDCDKPICSFDARVQGQAGRWKCLMTCIYGQEISYSEHILWDVILHGLVDSEIQLDLSDSNQNMTLEEVFQFIEKRGRSQQGSAVNTVKTCNSIIKKWPSLSLIPVLSVENMAFVRISPAKSGNNTSKHKTLPATLPENSTTLNANVNSNRRTKRYKLANQTTRWHYLIVYVQRHHCNSMQMLQPHSP